MENASGASTIARSLRSSLRALLLRPHTIVFARPFAYIAMVYGGTYLTANTLDTCVATTRDRPASHVTSGTAKFAASSAANVGLCIYKDQAFVRMFGPPGVAPRAVPFAAYALFTMRDCMTIFASFNVPPLLGSWVDSRLGEDLKKRLSGATVAQFAAPALMQTMTTPLHLWGLDLYNRPSVAGKVGAVITARDRWLAVRRNWAVSVAARVCRIVPAFGVGGVVNTKLRKRLMTGLE
jgi:hypothetical protein